MTNDIPSIGPDEGMREFNARRTDRDVAPVYPLRPRPPETSEEIKAALSQVTDIPDDDAPVGEVFDVAPGALVRRPLPVTRRSSSTAGIQALKAGAAMMRDAGLDPDVAEVIAESITVGTGVAREQESAVAAFDPDEFAVSILDDIVLAVVDGATS